MVTQAAVRTQSVLASQYKHIFKCLAVRGYATYSPEISQRDQYRPDRKSWQRPGPFDELTQNNREQHKPREHRLVSRAGPLAPYEDFMHAPAHPPKIVDGAICTKRNGGWLAVSGRLLRDACPCCRNSQTGQKSVNVLRLSDADCAVVSATENPRDHSFEVEFGDGHRSTFPNNTFTDRRTIAASQWRYGLVPLTTWTADVATAATSVQYEDVKAGPGMAKMLRTIREFGFAFVDNVPVTPEATEELLLSIGPIRDTHYGAFYDFTSNLASKDTAYTNEALEPHTDTTYFTESIGLQALHMLSHEEGSGGESTLVDGFGAATRLYNEDSEAYYKLSTTGVYSHASGNDGVNIQSAQPYPTLNHNPALGYLSQVRWNTADRAGLATATQHAHHWYRAAAKFDAILSEPANVYRFQLKPGKVLIFDNWRVLHGRTAFTGKRRMCGGYINRDDFISKFRMTNHSPRQIQAALVAGCA